MAKKKKLTKGQVRRVRTNQSKRLKQEDTVQWDEEMLGATKSGLVITRFGQHADIEDMETHEIHRCNLRRGIESLVSGDRVIWRAGLESMAGNIDQMVIVSSVLPELSLNIIDRYLIASETLHIAPLIVLNKVDLLKEEQLADYQKQLSIYEKIGYQVLFVSKESGYGIEALEAELKDKMNIFVGQSGVGKSSLVNALLPEVDVEEGAVSENSGLGQHTTTAARLYHFSTGGDLIDSPGIREFGLWHLEQEEVTEAFIEFRPYLGGCKFRDCKHLDDPGCVLREAAENDDISLTRFESYHRIIDSMGENKANRQYSRNKKADF